jgi:hypothetical protein
MLTQKKFSQLLLIIGIIGALIIGSLFFGKSRNFFQSIIFNNSNQLKSYKNDSFGFEFQYDKDSKVTYEVKNGHNFIDGVDRGPFAEKKGVIVRLSNDNLWVTRKGRKMNDTNYFLLELGENCVSYNNSNPTYKVINGLTFQYYEVKNGIEGKGIVRVACLTENGKNWSLVNQTYFEENFEKTGKLFNQILSSFKLTD